MSKFPPFLLSFVRSPKDRLFLPAQEEHGSLLRVRIQLGIGRTCCLREKLIFVPAVDPLRSCKT